MYLKTHLHRTHGLQTKKKESVRNDYTENKKGKYVCTVEICRKEFDNLPILLKHLKVHITKTQEKITCPFRRCRRQYTVLSSFTSHLSKIHKNHEKLLLDHDRSCSTENTIQNSIADEVTDERPLDINDHINISVAPERQEIQPDINLESDLFLYNVAQFYLKLESQLLIPASTIQLILEESNSIHNEGQAVIQAKLKDRLISENITPEDADRIVKECFHHDSWIQSNNKLSTDYRRKTFYKQQFHYVKPQFIEIHKQTKTSSAYVPILETLEKLFNDKSVENAINLTAQPPKDELLTDFTDGKVFCNNKFFRNEKKGLQVILYQDSFEVVNPIGSAKKKHKILAIYMSIGNLPDNLRSHINTIKLVVLCKEIDFDHKKVYGQIVDDIKTLEERGIQINGNFIKGSLVFITGDNLGSHSLGGFVENFIKSHYFCRYCLVTRNEFHSSNGSCKVYEPRTIESYNNALSRTNNKDYYQGVKFDSVFNQLTNYHICLPGLP